MIRVLYRSDPRLAIANAQELAKAFTSGAELPAALQVVHGQIENIVKASLVDPENRKRDDNATSSTGRYEADIMNIITSSVYRTKTLLVGGTGNKEYMDTNDPLVTVQGRSPGHEQVRLWRILEWGVEGPYPITAKSSQSPMAFWWKRKHTKFIGVPSNAPHDQPIMHPGQEPRRYWETALYDSEQVFHSAMHAVISALVGRYSR